MLTAAPRLKAALASCCRLRAVSAMLNPKLSTLPAYRMECAGCGWATLCARESWGARGRGEDGAERWSSWGSTWPQLFKCKAGNAVSNQRRRSQLVSPFRAELAACLEV